MRSGKRGAGRFLNCNHCGIGRADGPSLKRCERILMFEPKKRHLQTASVHMGFAEIDVRQLKTAVNAVLDHLVEDLHLEKITIDQNQDFYWDCPYAQLCDVSKKPTELDVGRLSDDVDLIKNVRRGESADASYNLVHVFPLLRYIAENIRH